jgi:4'-phosphopantetheinyl transferase
MIAWSLAPSPPALPADEVHVWSAALTVGQDQLRRMAMLLDASERHRAGRYVHIRSREQYVIARGVLRILLGRYLDVAPTTVRFASGPQGKPLLVSGGRELHFNVSHSEGMALIAVTRRSQVGVDVERIRPCETYLDMADRFFTPGEAAALRSLPTDRSEEAFFHVWTRKEAFLKALGLGLSHGLERFEVSVLPNDPPRIKHIDGDPCAGAKWSLTHLTPAPGYVGALAVEGQGHRLCCWNWGGSVSSIPTLGP